MHEILHKCLHIPVDDMIFHIKNGDIKVNFSIVIPICIQMFAVHVQLLVCERQARLGVLLGKDTFHQV